MKDPAWRPGLYLPKEHLREVAGECRARLIIDLLVIAPDERQLRKGRSER